MEIKLNKKLWSPWISILGSKAELDLGMGLILNFKKETKNDIFFTNCTTADAEVIAQYAKQGMSIKSRYTGRNFVEFDDPTWRG